MEMHLFVFVSIYMFNVTYIKSCDIQLGELIIYMILIKLQK